jgi:cytochrome P450
VTDVVAGPSASDAPADVDNLTPLPASAAPTRVKTQTGRLAWQVNDYAAVKFLSRDSRLADADPNLVHAESKRRALPRRASQASDGDEEPVDSIGWARVLRKAFSPELVDSLAPRIAEIVSGLLDGIAAGRRDPDLHNGFSSPLVTLVSCALLGMSEADGYQTRSWWQAVKTGTRAEAEQGQAAMLRYVRELYASRKREPGEDLVSALVEAQGPDDPYLEDVLKFLTSLISKGRETPTNALDWGIVLLLREPEQYQCLVRDRALTEPAVEEVLRLFPVISGKIQGPEGIRRFALSDFTVATRALRRGDLVLLNVVAANMDTAVFAQPERFDITRDPNPHLSFGFGPHSCPASRLARLELVTAINGLLDRFPTLRLSIAADELRYRERPTSEGFETLPVTW